MSNGCICCTLRDDLLEEVRRLAREGRFDYLLIESTGVSEPMPVAETFFFRDEFGFCLDDISSLDTMVTVVDAANFESDFGSPETLMDRGQQVGTDDDRTIVDLLVDQIEFADVVILNKIDAVEETTKTKIISAIKAINSRAALVESAYGNINLNEILNTNRFDIESAEQMPDWLKIIEKAKMVIMTNSVMANITEQLNIGKSRHYIPRTNVFINPTFINKWIWLKNKNIDPKTNLTGIKFD